MQAGKTANPVAVLLSPAFQERASGWANEIISREFIGDWGNLNADNLLQGQVTGPNGQPLPFAEILIREHNPGAEAIAAPNLGTSEQGYYKYDEMDWPYRITAVWKEPLPSCFGYGYQDLLYNRVLEGSQTVNFSFESFPSGDAALTGKIQDQYENPLKEFYLDLGTWYKWKETWEKPDDNFVRVMGYRFPFISKDGSFKLSNLPADTYSVHVIPFLNQAYNYHKPVEVKLEAGKETKINLEVTAENVYYGRVVFEDGSPALIKPAPSPGDKTSIILQIEGDFMATGITQLDAEGYFMVHFNEKELENLKTGKARLLISVPSSQENWNESMREFPFDLLSKEWSRVKTVKVPRPQPANPETTPDNNPTAELPNGVTVELVGFSHWTDGKLQWYSPRGTTIQMPGVTEADVDGLGSVIALRVTPSDPDVLFYVYYYQGQNYKNTKETWKVGTNGLWLTALGIERKYVNLSFEVYRKGSWQQTGIIPVDYKQLFPKEDEYGRVEINRFGFGISAISRAQFASKPDNHTILISGVSSISELRNFSALDKNGNILKPDRSESSDTSCIIEFNYLPEGLAGITGQTREILYSTFQFKNISLIPGQKSDVKIEIETPEKPDDPNTITESSLNTENPESLSPPPTL